MYLFKNENDADQVSITTQIDSVDKTICLRFSENIGAYVEIGKELKWVYKNDYVSIHLSLQQFEILEKQISEVRAALAIAAAEQEAKLEPESEPIAAPIEETVIE